jgi:endonuclease YncB( thermonuclease family)
MRSFPFALAIVATLVCVNVSSPDDRQLPSSQGQSLVVKERVRGGIAYPPERMLLRITGRVRVADPCTLIFDDGTEVILRGGMDAPAMEQQGLIGDSLYPAGKKAAEFLKTLIDNKKVTCFARPKDVVGKRISGGAADCFVGETNLEIEMVRNGWAVSNHSGIDCYEVFARENKRGLWRGQFIPPARWRKGERLPGEQP